MNIQFTDEINESIRVVSDIANSLTDDFELSPYESLRLSIDLCKLDEERKRNGLIRDAFVLYGGGPSALEAIAMVLGYTPNGSGTIKDAIHSIQNNNYEL